MRTRNLPPLVVAMSLLFGAAAKYPDGAGTALGSVGFLVLGMWLTLEMGSEVAERWQRARSAPENRGPRDYA